VPEGQSGSNVFGIFVDANFIQKTNQENTMSDPTPDPAPAVVAGSAFVCSMPALKSSVSPT